jgi:hypothetical protein
VGVASLVVAIVSAGLALYALRWARRSAQAAERSAGAAERAALAEETAADVSGAARDVRVVSRDQTDKVVLHGETTISALKVGDDETVLLPVPMRLLETLRPSQLRVEEAFRPFGTFTGPHLERHGIQHARWLERDQVSRAAFRPETFRGIVGPAIELGCENPAIRTRWLPVASADGASRAGSLLRRCRPIAWLTSPENGRFRQ